MEAAARVCEVDAERARLACDPSADACPRCSGGGGCMLRRLSAGPAGLLEVSRRAACGRRLEVGARVTVTVGEGELLRAAARAYLPPLVGVLAGPLLTLALAPAGDGWTLLGASAGLVLGWTLARLWLRRVPPGVSVRMHGAGSREP